MTCPCGYDTECGIWCGNGHRNGLCHPYPMTTKEQAVIKAAFKWYKQEDDTWWHEDICDCGACDLARAVIDLRNGSVE